MTGTRRGVRARLRLGLLLAALVLGAPTFTNPVIPGDHPDPSVVRAGGAFFASATTSSWAPVFPVFRSPDLVNWQQVGSVLPHPPAWTNGKFWAPELAHERGRFMAYWGAARRDGKPCIALSIAARAEGPWRYRGRVVCPPGGAIDASPFRDVDGSRWLLWKAMGPGNGIRIARLSADGRRVLGPSQELIRPEPGWEQSVTEAPSLVRMNGKYLLFYSGGHCCRVPCSYGEGVAQATSVLGPYVKDPDNPVLRSGPDWKCPGHGTVVRTGAAAFVLVHHAYRADDAFDVRREVLVDPVTIGADGWPVIGTAAAVVDAAPSPLGAVQQPHTPGFSDGFGNGLQQGWEWLFDAPPSFEVKNGELDQRCAGPLRFVGRQVTADRVVATTAVTPAGDAAVGLAVNLGYGVRGIEVRHGHARAFVASPERVATGPSVAVPLHRRIVLALGVAPGGELATYVGDPAGHLVRVDAGPAETGSQPTRVVLTCRGKGIGRFAYVRARAAAGT
jgi:xylan 1,4-beta-xylosidase